MKEIIIKVDDELYDQAKKSRVDLDSLVNEQVIHYLTALSVADLNIATARARMNELFQTTKGFGLIPKPSREEMHERGRVR